MTGEGITTEEKLLLQKILYIHRMVLAKKPKCPNLIKGVEHKIQLKKGVDHRPAPAAGHG